MRRLGEANPAYRSRLRRLLLFREADVVVDFAAVIRHVPDLVDLTLFGWEFIRVEPTSWRPISRNLINIELIGLGFNASAATAADNAVGGGGDGGENSSAFDVSLLAEAVQLRRLRLAGWGDTTLQLDQLLDTLPGLDSLYLEDVKINLQNNSNSSSSSSSSRKRKRSVNHGLTHLNICHCSTTQVV